MIHSGDTAFVAGIYPKLSSILSAFIERMDPESSLVPPFSESDAYWNFYEWENGLSGRTEIGSFIDGITEYNRENRSVPDLILNSLLLIAIDIMMKISERLGYSNPYSELSESLRKSIRAEFFSEPRGLFLDRKGGEAASKLGNSLAILAGVATREEASRIVSDIFGGTCEMTEISLSMVCFLYDAAIMADREKYAPAILADIEKKYRPMVEAGIGTVWETELGESDFSDAGSLCHGWSAMPIYYFHILKCEAGGKI